jgi:hypothetical protein
MALKGKSKSRRGSSRRPAGAPRMIASQRRRVPWWRTRAARIWFAIAGLAILLIVLWLVKNSRDEAAAMERKQDAVEEFTSQISTLQQSVAPPAGQMITATADTPNLAAEAERWSQAFDSARADLTEATRTTPAGLDVAHRLFFQAILQYTAAAETYALVADLDGNLQDRALERANAQVSAADGVWQSAVAILDEQRTRAELSVSRFTVPTTGGISAQPTPTPPGQSVKAGKGKDKDERKTGNRRRGGD